MRVLAIRGRNLASLEGDFAVDFEAEPLASAGIFAITGPTGAGKSTLLDAVCLALFNRLPRLTSASAGQVGAEGGEAISATDPRAVLRHRASEGFAEVDFVGRDRVRYRARWTVRRARGRVDGTLQNVTQELTDLDTGERIGGTRSETLEAIRERVGLTSDQFARAVMLAQGDFEAFVRADANDRAALLEKLTGTGIYAQLGVAAKRKADQFRAELALIEQRIADQRGLDDVARSEAETRLQDAQAALASVGEALARLERDRQWYELGTALSSRLLQAQATLDGARSAREAAAPRREALRQRARAFAFVGEWRTSEEANDKARSAAEQVTALETALAEARAEAERLGDVEAQATEELGLAQAAFAEARPTLEQARSLDRELDRIAAELTPLEASRAEKAAALREAEAAWQQADSRNQEGEAECAALGQWISAHEGRRALALREQALRADLGEHAELVDQVTLLVGQGSTKAAEAKRYGELRTAADEAVARAREAHAAAQQALERAQADAPSSEALEAATRTRDALAALEPKFAAVERCNERAGALGSDAARVEAERTHETEVLARHVEQARQIEQGLPLLRGQFEEARRSSALSSAAADDAAARLRDALIAGEPCPVCGSRDHAAEAVAALIDERSVADRERLAALEIQVGTQEREAAVLAERIRAGERRIETLMAQGQQIASSFASARGDQDRANGELSAAAAVVGILVEADLAVTRAALATRLAAADRNRIGLEAARQALDEARRAAERHRADRDAAEAARARAVETERNALAEEAELSRRIANLRERQQRLRAELDQELASHFDWAEAGDPVDRLERLTSEWRTREREHGESIAALPHLKQAVHAAELERSAAKSVLEQAEASMAALGERRRERIVERSVLFGGQATAAVEQRLEGAIKAAAASSEAARNAASDARGRLSAAEARLGAGRERQQADQVEAVRRATELTNQLGSMGLTAEAVAAEARAGEGALQIEEEALTRIDEAVTRAAAEHAARASDEAAHRATGAPELSPEALGQAIADAEAGHSQARRAEGDAALVIRQDDAARAATAALRAEHAGKQSAAQVWLQLDLLIGDATGNKFRRFAQGLTLDRLLLHANARLGELQPRYELQRGAGGDMLVQVVDHDMAGEVRGLHNLSGGERFLVSLALALGLSEMSSGEGLRIESLFIDEGFGALDSASLGSAIAMLEQLHASGRRVGVISHIEEVKERIPVKIAVTPVGRGRSTVELLAE